jgi:hypothetical protein
MKAVCAISILLVLTSCAVSDAPRGIDSPQDAFWANLRQHCGSAFAGGLTVARPDRMPLRGDEAMIVDFRECSDTTLRLPFHIERPATADWDRSRTWIFTRTATGLELRHDHRHEDGSPDENTMYGGHTASSGSAHHQIFVFDERRADDGSILGWRIEIHPGERYTYGTISGTEWTWRVDFDLTETIPPPPPPW